MVCVIQTTEMTRAGSARWESPEARSNSKGRCSSWHRSWDSDWFRNKNRLIQICLKLNPTIEYNRLISTAESLHTELHHYWNSFLKRNMLRTPMWYCDTWYRTHFPSTFSFLLWMPHWSLSLVAQSCVYHPDWEPVMQNLPFVYRVYRTSLNGAEQRAGWGMIGSLCLVRSPTSTSVPPPDTRTRFQDVSRKN